MGRAELALVIIMLAGLLAALISGHTDGPPDNWLYHYQTLLVGLLALGSAGIAAFLLHRQTQTQERIERERRTGQREAARSWLALHLSAIISYAQTTGKGIWKIMEECEGHQLPPEISFPSRPPLPLEAAAALKDFVKYANLEEARYVSEMLSIMQVLDSRTSSLLSSPETNTHSNLESYLMDAAALYSHAESLLEYARHETQEFPKGVTWKRFSAAFFFITHRHEPTPWITNYMKDRSNGDYDSFMPNRFAPNR